MRMRHATLLLGLPTDGLLLQFVDLSRTRAAQVATTPDQNHGTHVAGICCGEFPKKLFFANDTLVPHQQGVAFNSQLGVYRGINVRRNFLSLHALRP